MRCLDAEPHCEVNPHAAVRGLHFIDLAVVDAGSASTWSVMSAGRG
jgi:hypothetical protein